MHAARIPRRTLRAQPEQTAGPTAAVRTGLSASLSPARERARKRLVWTVLTIYLLAIFEGAIRKYIAPQLGQYIFFIRDPFLVYGYILATRFALWPRHHGFLMFSLGMCAFGVLLFILQIAMFGLDNTRVILGVNGWRSYFFYVPLAFLIGAQFRREDLRLFTRVTLLLAVPVAILVTAQFASPPNAPINVGVAEEQELQFKSVGITVEKIRTTGTFTSPAGQQQFIGSAFALLLATLLLPRRQFSTAMRVIAACGVLTCVALSGSRGSMLTCGVSGLFAMGLAFVGKSAALKTKALVLPLGLIVAAALLYPIVFPEGFETFMYRWDGAAKSEQGIPGGVFGRAILGNFHFLDLIGSMPPLGYGLGYGSNASITLGAVVDGIKPGLLVEADFSRHMVDLGPVFGLAYIAVRIWMTVWLAGLVLAATRRAPDPLPVMLFSYAGLVLLSGQITGNGTINVYGWLFTGLCIAASRVAAEPARGRQGVAPGRTSPAALAPRGRLPLRASSMSSLRRSTEPTRTTKVTR